MNLLFYTLKLVEAKEVVSYKPFNVRPALLRDQKSQWQKLKHEKKWSKKLFYHL